MSRREEEKGLPNIDMSDLVRDPGEIGIPKEYSFCQLLYNHSTQTLIVEAVTRPGDYELGRIFRRHRNEKTYTIADEPGPDVTYRFPVSCNAAPLVYFTVFQIVGAARERGANWTTIKSLDCISGSINTAVERGQLVLPPPYISAWVASLVNAWPDGTGLDCVVGMASAQESELRYFLARLDLRTRSIEPIAELKAIVF